MGCFPWPYRSSNQIVKKLIDFFENAEGIVISIQSSLDNLCLTLDNVSAFSADNANVNYGIHNSVYTKLRESNSKILRSNCHAHIVHNTVKHELGKFAVDVENIILKVYGHVSVSAKRRESCGVPGSSASSGAKMALAQPCNQPPVGELDCAEVLFHQHR